MPPIDNRLVRGVADRWADGGWPAGYDRARQVLVVGDGLPAATCAGFLAQAGLDPVLARPASTDETRPHDRLVALWRPGLALLERLGLRRPVERRGTRVDRLECPTTGRSHTADADGPPSVVVVRSSDLRRVLDRQLIRRLRTPEQPVLDVESTDAGISCTFEDGIVEPFDVAVVTTPSLVTQTGIGGSDGLLHCVTFDWPSASDPPTAPTEVWGGHAAVFAMPLGSECVGRLVAGPGADISDLLDRLSLADLFDRLWPSRPNPFATRSVDPLTYRRVTATTPGALRSDTLALLGNAARPARPGSLLGPALGVEDAWVLADALAYEARTIDSALSDYDRRRRGRGHRIERHVATCDRPGMATLSPPLTRLCGARTLALAHVHHSTVSPLARSIPSRL